MPKTPPTPYPQEVSDAGDYLFPGRSLADSYCGFYTTMQSDGNMVTYGAGVTSFPFGTPTHAAVWASNTMNKGGYARMQDDGNFVVYSWSDQPVWASGTVGDGGDFVEQGSNALLFIRDPTSLQIAWNNSVLWGDQRDSPCPVSENVTTLWPGWDCPGNDYESLALAEPRASWCGYYCSQDSKCGSFTYVPPGVQGPSAMC